MPSFLLGFISGGQNLLSGNWWSGQGSPTNNGGHPVGGVQLLGYYNNSGYIYVSLSGGLTIQSGGLNASGYANGSGFMDAIPIGPNQSYFIPKLAFPGFLSGNPQLWVNPDAASSGSARIALEIY